MAYRRRASRPRSSSRTRYASRGGSRRRTARSTSRRTSVRRSGSSRAQTIRIEFVQQPANSVAAAPVIAGRPVVPAATRSRPRF